MTNLTNIQRDSIYFDPDDSKEVDTGTGVVTGNAPTVNNSGAVNVDFGSLKSGNTSTTLTAGNTYGHGVLIQPPYGERTPYRIKAYGKHLGSVGVVQLGIIVGIAPASPTGTDDQIDDHQFFPFNDYFDDLIMIEPHATNPDRAVFVGIGYAAINTTNAGKIAAALSVQNLGVKPPTMQNACC